MDSNNQFTITLISHQPSEDNPWGCSRDCKYCNWYREHAGKVVF